MQKLLDKIVLLGLCLLMLSFTEIGWYSIVSMLCAVAVSALSGYYDNWLPAFLCVGFVVLCLFVPETVIFLPLVVYDCAGLSKLPLRFCWVVALIAGIMIGAPQIVLGVVLSSGTAFLLQVRTSTHSVSREELFLLRDDAKERSESLERKNRELVDRQNYEIRLATLAERNRIAREIHDNVGHMLTRSLLQIGALRVTHGGDERLGGELDLIKGTLSDAMDSIRSSVHNLHDESIDLKARLEAMVDGFVFCPVKLRYDAGDLPAEVKYCFAAIVREALSNIARHSGATEAAVNLIEHPSFYQLVVSDNGRVKSDAKLTGGIGLQNMADRVEALGGVFRTEYSKGFRVFISVPK